MIYEVEYQSFGTEDPKWHVVTCVILKVNLYCY